jgi:hypothetical protein
MYNRQKMHTITVSTHVTKNGLLQSVAMLPTLKHQVLCTTDNVNIVLIHSQALIDQNGPLTSRFGVS